MTVHLTEDDVWPRVPEYRYRLYARRGLRLEVLAAAPDPGGIGAAIVQLHEDEKAARPGGRLADRGVIGVLDVLPDRPSTAEGEWIVLPWQRSHPLNAKRSERSTK